jgi:hypothetical protein
VLGVASNTWKIEAVLAGAGLKDRLVADLDGLQRRLLANGIEPYLYTSTELERICAFRKEAVSRARAMFRSICQSAVRAA